MAQQEGMQQSGVRNTAKCNESIMRACMLRRLCLKGKDDASLHLFSMQGKTVKVARRIPRPGTGTSTGAPPVRVCWSKGRMRNCYPPCHASTGTKERGCHADEGTMSVKVYTESVPERRYLHKCEFLFSTMLHNKGDGSDGSDAR